MCYPTSRKKYYLQTPINPEWMDADLISDLYNHIVSTSGHPLRDIFIAHSRRIGFFSVRSEETAEKLVKSFANNYISSGRKSSAEIIKISENNYQIKVSNINNIMTSKEFEEWILSLNYRSFDIQLLPSQLLKPSHECILSFDSINAAIAVKQKLQDLTFRGFPLYFTHWHVPRRVASHSDSNSQCSGSVGYSTANSTPVGNNGPLYLRDSNVPPPPTRSPPRPPLPLPVQMPSEPYVPSQRMDCVTNSSPSTPDINQLKINVHSSPFKTHNEHKTPECDEVHMHRLQVQKQQMVIDELIKHNQSVHRELTEEKNFSKYMNTKYSELYKHFVSLNRLNTILAWDVDRIIGWIMSLDNGWFIKYKPNLVFRMNLQRMNGAMLSKANRAELYHLGVTDAKDQCLLLNHIHNLFGQSHGF